MFLESFTDINMKNAFPFVGILIVSQAVGEQDEDVSSNLQSISSASEACESDQQTDDSDLDNDCLVFPIINLESADDVCVKLDRLVRNGTICKSSIFYKHIKDVLYFFINPRNNQYDEEVVEFFNTIRYLGGESTANFVRGTAFFVNIL